MAQVNPYATSHPYRSQSHSKHAMDEASLANSFVTSASQNTSDHQLGQPATKPIDPTKVVLQDV